MIKLWRCATKVSKTFKESCRPAYAQGILENQIPWMESHINSLPPIFPQKRIPNVRNFKVKALSNHHPIFEEAGIKKREFSPLMEYENYVNKSQNRYIKHNIIRLNKLRSNPTAFWHVGEILMNKSSAFASLMVHDVYPSWYRKESYGTIWNAVQGYRKLDLTHYDYHEKAIPKPDGTSRYLGVPSPSWRLYLHGLQLLLQIWLSPYSSPDQHGYIIKKGTKTAWIQIQEEVLGSPNIYEFDFKKYFDSINLDYLQELLLGTRIPPALVSQIIQWSRTRSSNHTVSRHHWDTPTQEACDYHYHKTGTYVSLSPSSIASTLLSKREDEKLHPELRDYSYYHGVAQGSAISPILSNLVITYTLLLNPYCQKVQFADDGLLYNLTRSPESILTFPPASGLSINWSKSGWVKRRGHWLKSLKFLGLRANPTPSDPLVATRQGVSLENATRTPRTFTFSQYDLIESAALYDNRKLTKTLKSPTVCKSSPQSKIHHPDAFSVWYLTKYAGYVQARLYAGNLDLTSLQQDFTLSFKKYSWTDLERVRRQHCTVTLPYTLNGHDESKLELTVFNISSFAHKALSNRILRTLRPKALTGFTH